MRYGIQRYVYLKSKKGSNNGSKTSVRFMDSLIIAAVAAAIYVWMSMDGDELGEKFPFR